MSELQNESGLPADAARGLRFGVIVSRFNREVTEPLRDGAVAALRERGAAEEDLTLVQVPGAYELPMAAHRVAREGAVDGVVCVGALIRGETIHFDVLSYSVAIAVQDVARETGVPVTLGVLTCEDLEQARARAGGDRGNKGREAALAALEMALLYRDGPAA